MNKTKITNIKIIRRPQKRKITNTKHNIKTNKTNQINKQLRKTQKQKHHRTSIDKQQKYKQKCK